MSSAEEARPNGHVIQIMDGDQWSNSDYGGTMSCMDRVRDIWRMLTAVIARVLLCCSCMRTREPSNATHVANLRSRLREAFSRLSAQQTTGPNAMSSSLFYQNIAATGASGIATPLQSDWDEQVLDLEGQEAERETSPEPVQPFVPNTTPNSHMTTSQDEEGSSEVISPNPKLQDFYEAMRAVYNTGEASNAFNGSPDIVRSSLRHLSIKQDAHDDADDARCHESDYLEHEYYYYRTPSDYPSDVSTNGTTRSNSISANESAFYGDEGFEENAAEESPQGGESAGETGEYFHKFIAASGTGNEIEFNDAYYTPPDGESDNDKQDDDDDNDDDYDDISLPCEDCAAAAAAIRKELADTDFDAPSKIRRTNTGWIHTTSSAFDLTNNRQSEMMGNRPQELVTLHKYQGLLSRSLKTITNGENYYTKRRRRDRRMRIRGFDSA